MCTPEVTQVQRFSEFGQRVKCGWRLYVAIHGSRSERAHARLVLDVAAELQGMAGSPTIGTEDAALKYPPLQRDIL
eukprot:291682-Amphidinium_carterae.1